jgi:hypothetical protein
MILSSGFSTERDEPVLSDDDKEDEHWNEKANNNRRNSVNVKSIFIIHENNAIFWNGLSHYYYL